MKIILNGKEEYYSGDSLKTFLMEKGFNFPCAARGICGKCIIKAKDLDITDRDRRFLSDTQLLDGFRLACDKMVFEGLCVDADIVKVPHLTECDAYAIIYKDKVEVGIVSEDFCEKRVKAVMDVSCKTLRSTIAHELLEMLEKYSVAKATTIFIAGEKEQVGLVAGSLDINDGGSYTAADLMMPAEEVFIVPFRDNSSSVDYLIYKNSSDIDTAIKRVVKDFRFRLKL